MLSKARAFQAATAWTAVVLFAFGFACQAEIEVELLSADQDVAPGAFATPVFVVRSTGADALSVKLQFAAPDGWQILSGQESLPLQPGEEATVFATVVVPADASPGRYTIGLTAVSSTDPADQASATAVIGVEAVSAIELIEPMSAKSSPGTVVEYEVPLVNRGTAQETVRISPTSSRRFRIELSQAVFDLAPQERATIGIRLYIPEVADPGQDVLTLTAVSTLYAGVEDEIAVFTTILPPTPDTVGGTMMEILPARLRLSIDKDVFSGRLDSRLTFSTSGRILDGFFSSFVSATDPFGPDPLDVTSYSILYRRQPAVARLGNVSKRLTDLVGLFCEGGSFEVDDDLVDLIVVGGKNDDEAQFGGRFALGPETANVGLTFFDARSPVARRAVAGATAETEPLEDWRILTEAALGTNGGMTSRAFLFGTEIDTEGYFLDGEVFSVGTSFPGSDEDTAGIRLSQRLRLPDLSLSLSLAHEWDNVTRNPLLSTEIEDQLGFNLRATPMKDGPTLTSTVEFEWQREDDPTQMSEIDFLLAVGLRETSGVFPFTFSGEIEDRVDLAFGSHTRTLTFREGAGLSVDSFYLFLELTQEKRIDVVTDTVLSGETDVSLLFRPEGTLHEAAIRLENTVDAFDLSASIFVRFLERLDITFDGSISWDRTDATPVSFDWGIGLNADLNIPLPFFVTKGRVEGRLFIDVDQNGIYDEADRPVRGAIIEANGTEVSTADDGRFRFPPLRGGSYVLEVRGLPPEASPPDPISLEVIAGELSTADIPLAPVITVDGLVFEDVDEDGLPDPSEEGFADVRVLLSRERDAEMIAARTSASGAFTFADLAPGTYRASLDPATLPPRFAYTTPETVELSPTVSSPSRVVFGGIIKPRQVVIALQPPTADFSFTPEAAAAGEPVTFDGSLSFDFDGEIVSYAWDLDGDGEDDATGAMVERTFSTPGRYEVSLTVTDDGGNLDTLTKVLDVEDTQGDEPAPGSYQPPIADFSYSPKNPRPGQSVAFDASASADFDGAIVSFAWDFDGDGAVDAPGPTVMHTFSEVGAYPVSLRVTDDEGNDDTRVRIVEVADTAQEPVDVRPTLTPPQADFSYTPGEPIAGEPVTFDGTPSLDPDGEIASFSWDFDGDGQPDSNEPIVEHVFPDPGVYPVRLAVTDAEGAEDAASYEVEVVGSPAESGQDAVLPPIADFSFSPGAPVAGEPVEFNGLASFDFDGQIESFSWDFDADGVFDADEAIVLHVFATPGTYRVRLTVTDDDGATDAIVRSIDVE